MAAITKVHYDGSAVVGIEYDDGTKLEGEELAKARPGAAAPAAEPTAKPEPKPKKKIPFSKAASAAARLEKPDEEEI